MCLTSDFINTNPDHAWQMSNIIYGLAWCSMFALTHILEAPGIFWYFSKKELNTWTNCDRVSFVNDEYFFLAFLTKSKNLATGVKMPKSQF